MQELLQSVWLCLPSQGVLARLVPLVLLLTLAGLPLLCLTGENLALLRQRVAYNKCARQLAFCGVVCGVLALLARVGTLVWDILARQPELTIQWQHLASATFTPLEQGAMLVCLCLLAGVFFLTLYAALWQRLRNAPFFHQVPGVLAALLCLAALYGQMCLLCLTLRTPDASLPEALFLPKPPDSRYLWPNLCFVLPLCPSLAGAVGALWLLARRKRDDYGRDYYHQMLLWCGRWARNAWVMVWVAFAGVVGLNVLWEYLVSNCLHLVSIVRVGLVLLWGIPALLWIIVCRSRTPLRHKPTILLAILLMCVCLAFLLPQLMPGDI